MTYARSRLWLGISGVGFIVVLASASLWFSLLHKLLSGLSDAASIALTLFCFIIISIPSDLLGGYVLPRHHGRSELTFSTFFVSWIRGVVAQAVVVGLCALAILEAGKWGGTTAKIACFALIMLLLVVAQSLVARLINSFGQNSQNSASKTYDAHTLAAARLTNTVFYASDPGFVGGVVGFPGTARLVVPAPWLRNLAPDVLTSEFTRRRGAIETGARTRGLLIAFFWNLIGFSLVCHMPGTSLTNAAGLVQTALWFTLWSFVGLLILPSLNRPAVMELDQFAAANGVSPELLATTISALDALQDNEPERARWIERVFHPIPSVNSRIAALRSPRKRLGGWQCARTTLYLSWACFGFLARAVHCNAGRPELWVLFPGD